MLANQNRTTNTITPKLSNRKPWTPAEVRNRTRRHFNSESCAVSPSTRHIPISPFFMLQPAGNLIQCTKLYTSYIMRAYVDYVRRFRVYVFLSDFSLSNGSPFDCAQRRREDSLHIGGYVPCERHKKKAAGMEQSPPPTI